MSPRSVRFLIFDGHQSLDLAGPHEVFAGANQWIARSGSARRPYAIEIIGPNAGPVPGESGLAISAHRSWRDTDPTTPVDTLIVVGGNGVDGARKNAELVAWLQAAAPHADRVASVCSGALLLGVAGLLDGRRATTHWARADELATLCPNTVVDSDPIHLHDDGVWTSAGVTAGIDLSLALVEADLGAVVAQDIARHLVMFLRRPGGQSQFAPALWHAPATLEPIRDAQDRIHAAPQEDWRIASLAAAVGMSARNFTRMFTRDIGVSPGRYIERIRVDDARRRLEAGPDGVAAVARAAGFGTAETMRRAFLRTIGVSPSDYRQRFRQTQEA